MQRCASVTKLHIIKDPYSSCSLVLHFDTHMPSLVPLHSNHTAAIGQIVLGLRCLVWYALSLGMRQIYRQLSAQWAQLVSLLMATLKLLG